MTIYARLADCLAIGLFSTIICGGYVVAQIVPDGTTNTVIDANGNSFKIDAGDRAGDNLFHSFTDFSVPDGGITSFNNAAEIVNIFTRVTGGNVSDINGLISANGEANLFLINPAGIIFGEGASLDLGGSFYASTADSIVFSDNLEFSAEDTSAPPLLTVNAPIGLNLGNNPGNIVNRSTIDNVGLQVAPGKNLALIGGNINLEGGFLTAPGGTVELGGLLASGEIRFKTSGSLDFAEGVERGNVNLNNQATVNVRANNGGAINVYANQLELTQASRFIAGIEENSDFPEAEANDIKINTNAIFAREDSQIRNENLGIGNAGDINIITETVEFTEGSTIIASTFGQGNAGNVTINATGNVLFDRDFGGVFSTAGVRSDENIVENVVGNAGDITIDANALTIASGARLVAKTAAEGDAGNVKINVADTVLIDGVGTSIVPFFLEEIDLALVIDSAILTQVAQNGVGNGGDINIDAKNLIVRNITENELVQDFNRALIAADNQGGIGDSGNITINTNDSILLDRGLILTELGVTPDRLSADPTFAEGEGGNINITTGSLTIKNESDITSRTEAIGNAGDIFINAANFIALEDGEIRGEALSDAIGNGGNLELNTSELTLTDNSLILADTEGKGNAGKITVDASNRITVDQSFISTRVDQDATGDSGGININTNNLDVTNNGGLTATADGNGNAGNIDIKANSIELNQGEIVAETRLGAGGEINLQLDETLSLNNNSIINAQAFESANGGNINIDSDFVIAFAEGDNDIIASAFSGNGGQINIETQELFGIESRAELSRGNDINASSEFGLDGVVEINTLQLDPTQGLTELPTAFIVPQPSQGCQASREGDRSSLVNSGRGGLPPNPYESLDNSSVFDDVQLPSNWQDDFLRSISPTSSKTKPIAEANTWVINQDGNVELIADKSSTVFQCGDEVSNNTPQ